MPSPVQFKFSSSSDGNQSQRDQRVDQHQPRKISCGEQGRDDRWGRLRGWANTRLPPGAGVLEPDGMPQAVLLPTEGLGDTLESSIPLPGPRLGPLGSLDANTSPPTPLRNLPQPTDTTWQAARRKPIRAPRYTSPQMSTFPGRPAVAEKVSASRRRPVSQRSLGIPSGRAQPTKPLPLTALPSLLCSMLKRCSTVLHANPRDCLPSLTDRPETRHACSPSRADRRPLQLASASRLPGLVVGCRARQSSLSGEGERQPHDPPSRTRWLGADLCSGAHLQR